MSAARRTIVMRDAFGQALVNLAGEIPEMIVLDADVSASTKTVAHAGAKAQSFL